MRDSNATFDVPVHVLKRALDDGALLAAERHGVVIPRPLSVFSLGRLSIQSGQLIAGDAGMAFEMSEPFVRRISPGDYEVFVAIWGLSGRGDSPSDEMGDTPRGAYLALKLANDIPATYEFASVGDAPLSWRPSRPYDGVGVDIGGVGLVDPRDLEIIRSQRDDFDFYEVEGRAYEMRPELAGIAGCLQFPTNPPVVVPSCESGWGDGSYFSYWGLNAAGEPVILIVDFNLDGKWTKS